MGRKKKFVQELEKQEVESLVYVIDPDQGTIEILDDIDMDSESDIREALGCESISVIPIGDDSAMIVNGDALNEEGLKYFHFPFLALPLGGKALLIGEFSLEELQENAVYMTEAEADDFRRKKFGRGL